MIWCFLKHHVRAQTLPSIAKRRFWGHMSRFFIYELVFLWVWEWHSRLLNTFVNMHSSASDIFFKVWRHMSFAPEALFPGKYLISKSFEQILIWCAGFVVNTLTVQTTTLESYFDLYLCLKMLLYRFGTSWILHSALFSTELKFTDRV